MSDMSNLEMLKQTPKSEMKPLEVEGASANALLEGQQEGVAEARQERKVEQDRKIEELLQEINLLTAEIAEQDSILALTQASVEKSQKVIASQPGSPAASIHEKVLATSQREIDAALAKKAELVGRKSAIEEIRNGLLN